MKIRGKKIKKRYIFGIIIILIIVFLVLRAGSNYKDSIQEHVVSEIDIKEEVILAGVIDVDDRVDLGFGSAGRVSEIAVKEGVQVFKGQTIARLSMNKLQSELLEAQAGLSVALADADTSDVDLVSAGTQLTTTVAEQNIIVRNALHKLLSDGLVAEPAKENQVSVTAPIVSGLYDGPEGIYNFRVERGTQINDYVFFLKGLESIRRTNIYDNASLTTPLGTKGLRISFPEDLNDYLDTQWVVRIPNTYSSTYITNKNAYDQAVATKERLVESAKDEVSRLSAQELASSRISKSDAQVNQAQAKVDSIIAQMQDGVIRAPFDGIVAKIDLQVGEVIQANTAYVTLLTEGAFDLVLNVPEIDVAKISVGDIVEIQLDSSSVKKNWVGEIYFIDVIDSKVDGVPVYETKVSLTDPDDSIRVGMNAKAKIVTQEKNGVLGVPKHFLERTAEGFLAKVKDGDDTREVLVITGIEGSDGLVEIISGLEKGEIVILEPARTSFGG